MRKGQQVMNKNKKKKRKLWKWIILIALIVIIVLGFKACSTASQNMMTMVETISPEKGKLEDYVSITGLVESDEIKYYYSPVNGRLSEVCVERGQIVKQGDKLISFDMEDMELYLEQARLQYVTGSSTYNGTLNNDKNALADLHEAKTNLAVLEQQIKDQKAYVKSLSKSLENLQKDTANSLTTQNYNLQKQLMELQKDPVTNAEAIKQIQMDMQTNEYLAQIAGTSDEQEKLQEKLQEEQERLAGYEQYKAEMEAQRQQAEAAALTSYQKENLSASEQLNLMSYERAQKDFEVANQGISADFDGIITELTVMEGMPVAESVQLLTLASTDKVKVTVGLGKFDLAKVKVGQSAEIEIFGNIYTGKVTKIDKMATASTNGFYQVGAEIAIDAPDENIVLGLDAKVKILTEAVEDVLLIPVEAMNADKAGDFIYVVENGMAVRRDVVSGISSTEFIEIKEGIAENDKVILSSLVGTIEEGMVVTDMAGMITEQEEP